MRKHSEERRQFGHVFRRGTTWWIRFRVGGKEFRESSHGTSQRAAEQLLGQRRAEYGKGEFIEVAARRTSFADLQGLVEQDYRASGYRSLNRVQAAYRHLGAAFAGRPATSITEKDLLKYRDARLQDGACPATVDLELRALGRGYRIARKLKLVRAVPDFPDAAAPNVRTGFFEREDFEAVLEELPPYLRPPLEFAYYSGWRISEVLGLTWDRVDLAAGVVRLDVGTTKNNRGRTLPFDVLPPLRALFAAQRAATTTVERRTRQIIPWVFWHHGGRQIKDFRQTWRAACERAAWRGEGPLRQLVRPALPDRIVHDLRRTAIRNLVRAGVPEKTAMMLTGHRTRTVFDRYDIVNESDLRAGLSKLAAALRGTSGAQPDSASPKSRDGTGPS